MPTILSLFLLILLSFFVFFLVSSAQARKPTMRVAFTRAIRSWTKPSRRRNVFGRGSSGKGSGGSGGGRIDGGGVGGGGGEEEGPGRGQRTGLFALAAMSWKGYLNLLETHPVTTKAITTGALNGLGDLLSQLVFEEGKSWNVGRTTRFTLLGLLFVGPALHTWYQVLNRVVPSPKLQGTIVRLALDQFAFAPFFIGSIFTLLLAAEGRISDVPLKMEQDFKETLITNWKVWIPFQFLNFKLVPLHLQVAGANAIALFWNIYISYTAHRQVDAHAE